MLIQAVVRLGIGMHQSRRHGRDTHVKWATRPGVHVDRAACAWLIRRFVDPAAEFIFPADPAAVPADATPFDMRGAALGHHQDRCSFETALAAFGLRGAAGRPGRGLARRADGRS